MIIDIMIEVTKVTKDIAGNILEKADTKSSIDVEGIQLR